MSRRSLVSLAGLMFVALLVWGNGLQKSSNLQTTASANSQTQAAAIYTVVPSEPVTLVTEPQDGIQPVLTKIAGAKTSIDLVMYELSDTDVEKALAAAEQRGVKVRVLLNAGLYGKVSSTNESAYTYLQSNSVPVEWTPSYFALTHQKTLIVDGTDALIMTFNLTPKYYSTSRDFAIDDPDSRDVSAIEQAFTDDWNDMKDTASNGDDLVWSPGSKPELLAMINAAKKSLLVYNEELSDSDIISALQAAAARGVTVQILMTDQSDWHSAFTTITNAGGEVHTYDPNAPLYIHAKMILVDGTQAFIGSENFSSSSLNSNRELGILVSNSSVVSELSQTFNSDWQGASPSW